MLERIRANVLNMLVDRDVKAKFETFAFEVMTKLGPRGKSACLVAK